MKRYVRFTSSGVKVDIDAYLNTKRGKDALGRIEKASKRFDRKQGGEVTYLVCLISKRSSV